MVGLVHVMMVASLLQGPAVTPPDPKWSIVTVLPGDTLPSLATRFGVDPAALAAWNPQAPDPLSVGTRLRVLSTVPSVERFRMRYTLPSPTTWQALANRYKLPLKTLLALNRRSSGGRVKAGTRVTVYVTRDRWNGAWLDGGLQLQERPGLKVKEPRWSFGRPVAIRTLEQVADAIAERYPGSAMVVGDLSLKHGGRFKPHTSHRGGLDADFGFFLPDEPFTMKFTHKKPGQIDAERTWFMVRTLLESGRVKRILVDWYIQSALREQARLEGASDEQLNEWFQYPRKRWQKEGVIRHYKGHKNHFHIRFAESESEVIL
jgi:LysM repeat protein